MKQLFWFENFQDCIKIERKKDDQMDEEKKRLNREKNRHQIERIGRHKNESLYSFMLSPCKRRLDR